MARTWRALETTRYIFFIFGRLWFYLNWARYLSNPNVIIHLLYVCAMCILLCIRVYLWVARDAYVVMYACVCHFFRWPLKILTLFGWELNYDGNNICRIIEKWTNGPKRGLNNSKNVYDIFQSSNFLSIFLFFNDFILIFLLFSPVFRFFTDFFSNFFFRQLYDIFWVITPSDQNGTLRYIF